MSDPGSEAFRACGLPLPGGSTYFLSGHTPVSPPASLSVTHTADGPEENA